MFLNEILNVLNRWKRCIFFLWFWGCHTSGNQLWQQVPALTLLLCTGRSRWGSFTIFFSRSISCCVRNMVHKFISEDLVDAFVGWWQTDFTLVYSFIMIWSCYCHLLYWGSHLLQVNIPLLKEQARQWLCAPIYIWYKIMFISSM